MTLSLLQKLEDILKAADNTEGLTSSELFYPAFPDKKDIKSTNIANFSKIIAELYPNDEADTLKIRLNNCIYSVIDAGSDAEEKEYRNFKKRYNDIIKEVYIKVIRH